MGDPRAVLASVLPGCFALACAQEPLPVSDMSIAADLAVVPDQAVPDLRTSVLDLSQRFDLIPPGPCGDQLKNGAETDVDCGGGQCPACAPGRACLQPADCQSGKCASGKCLAAMPLALKFAPPVEYAVAGGPLQIALGDLSGDGRLDVAVTTFQPSGVRVLVNQGGGKLAPAVQYGDRPNSDFPWVVAADFDGDGRPDLAVSSRAVADAGTSAEIRFFRNQGGGQFVAAGSAPIDGVGPFGYEPMAVADFDGDGRLDLAVVSNGVTVLRSRGAFTFDAPTSYAGVLIPTFVVAADLSGDGRPDLATADYGGRGETASVLLNLGGARFGAAVSYATGSEPIAIAAADFNEDGRLDLAVASWVVPGPPSVASILLAKGGGAFAPASNYPLGRLPWSMAVADFNLDGLLDLVSGSSQDELTILGNAGGGKFGLPTRIPGALGRSRMEAGDIDGDGKPDLVISQAAAVSVMINVSQ